MILTDENEDLLKKLFTSLYESKQFNVGFSNGNVIRDRLIFFARTKGTDIDWNIIAELIATLSQTKEQVYISMPCNLALDVVKKHFIACPPRSMVYTELSQNGKLYIHIPDDALYDELYFVRDVPIKKIENEDIMAKSFIPWGTTVVAEELDAIDENESKRQAREIKDVMNNAKTILSLGHHVTRRM